MSPGPDASPGADASPGPDASPGADAAGKASPVQAADVPDAADAAKAARAAFRSLYEARGHAAENARAAAAVLEAAFAAGAILRTPTLGLMLADLARALDQEDGQRLGGKSAEAARFILRAISRELDRT